MNSLLHSWLQDRFKFVFLNRIFGNSMNLFNSSIKKNIFQKLGDKVHKKKRTIQNYFDCSKRITINEYLCSMFLNKIHLQVLQWNWNKNICICLFISLLQNQNVFNIQSIKILNENLLSISLLCMCKCIYYGVPLPIDHFILFFAFVKSITI